MDAWDDLRIDKQALTISELHQPSDDPLYWRRQSPQDRIKHTERLRQMNYGYDQDTERLQRVFTVIKKS
jgi:hypothetical protein